MFFGRSRKINIVILLFIAVLFSGCEAENVDELENKFNPACSCRSHNDCKVGEGCVDNCCVSLSAQEKQLLVRLDFSEDSRYVNQYVRQKYKPGQAQSSIVVESGLTKFVTVLHRTGVVPALVRFLKKDAYSVQEEKQVQTGNEGGRVLLNQGVYEVHVTIKESSDESVSYLVFDDVKVDSESKLALSILDVNKGERLVVLESELHYEIVSNDPDVKVRSVRIQAIEKGSKQHFIGPNLCQKGGKCASKFKLSLGAQKAKEEKHYEIYSLVEYSDYIKFRMKLGELSIRSDDKAGSIDSETHVFEHKDGFTLKISKLEVLKGKSEYEEGKGNVNVFFSLRGSCLEPYLEVYSVARKSTNTEGEFEVDWISDYEKVCNGSFKWILSGSSEYNSPFSSQLYMFEGKGLKSGISLLRMPLKQSYKGVLIDSRGEKKIEGARVNFSLIGDEIRNNQSIEVSSDSLGVFSTKLNVGRYLMSIKAAREHALPIARKVIEVKEGQKDILDEIIFPKRNVVFGRILNVENEGIRDVDISLYLLKDDEDKEGQYIGSGKSREDGSYQIIIEDSDSLSYLGD